jgi:hypothetical protein
MVPSSKKKEKRKEKNAKNARLRDREVTCEFWAEFRTSP